ncbi:MAG: ribosome-associated translation inhibitor RaiA [Desulfobacterota bacterium]|jgi:putative sigma-54 modulation protein|nr:ribosome-associated translation inhibitor RaiA [Thermodesulfobacteriota bacterium]
MQLSVSFRNLDPSDHLKNYAETRLNRIRKYMEEPIEVHVVLSVQKFRHTADVTINANGIKIKAQEETGDLYSAIDLVMDKIEKQIKRQRERLKEHKTELRPRSEEEEALPGEEEAVAEAPQVIKKERFFAKPMDVEEAAMQLRLSSNEFLVFTNAKTRVINVLYKQKDGNFGLIEPAS